MRVFILSLLLVMTSCSTYISHKPIAYPEKRPKNSKSYGFHIYALSYNEAASFYALVLDGGFYAAGKHTVEEYKLTKSGFLNEHFSFIGINSSKGYRKYTKETRLTSKKDYYVEHIVKTRTENSSALYNVFVAFPWALLSTLTLGLIPQYRSFDMDIETKLYTKNGKELKSTSTREKVGMWYSFYHNFVSGSKSQYDYFRQVSRKHFSEVLY